MKITGSVYVSVCLYQRISLTAEPIWFFFTMYLLIGPGNVYNYFGGEYHHLPKRNHPEKRKYNKDKGAETFY